MGNGMLCYGERHPLLLKCFITFLRCTRMLVGQASKSICNPLIMIHIMSLSPRPPYDSHHVIISKIHSQIAHKMLDLVWVPSQHGTWDDMMQWETSTAAKMVHVLPQMYMECERSFWKYLRAPYSSHNPIFVEVDSQIACKLPELG